MKLTCFDSHYHNFDCDDNDYFTFQTSMKNNNSTTKVKFLLLTLSGMGIFREELMTVVYDSTNWLVQNKLIRKDRFFPILSGIYQFIGHRLGRIQGIEEFKLTLKPNKKHQRSKSQQNVSKIKNVEQLSLKLLLLEKKLCNSHLETFTTEEVQNCEKNWMLQSVIEMSVLDVLSALECFSNRLTHNAYFLDSDYPVVNGKNLRNHLAHGNALVSFLLPSEFVNVLVNGKKLIESDDLLQTNKQIGKKIKNDPVKLKASHDGDLTSIHQQRELFLALTGGDVEKTKECIVRGADLLGRDLNSQNSLHFAAKSANLEMLKFVLKFHTDVYVQDDDGQTILHTAASNGRLFTVEYLLQDMKMSTDKRDNNLKTPLHCASQNGHSDVVKCLLKRGTETISKDMFGFTPLHYAVNGNHIEIANLLLKKESNVDSNQAFHEISALHLASEKGHLDITLALINKKANVNCRSDTYLTPLHFSAAKGHVKIVKLLIEKGADVNARSINKVTPLHFAVKNGLKETVDVLLNHGADVNAIDSNDLTPLAIAAAQGLLSIAILLMAKEAVLTDCYLNPLVLAASFGHYDIVKVLMDKFDSHSKTSALHEAALSGHRVIIELLVKEGMPIHTKWAYGGFSALHLAAHKGRIEVVDFLIAQGCDVDAKAGGSDPERVASCNNEEFDAFFDLPIFERRKRGTLPGNGQTALHLSSIRGHRDTVRSLLRNKANFQIKDKFGVDALSIIIGKEMTDILIEENIAVGLVECDIYTPLHLGCVKGDLKFVQYCIKKGCDIEAKNKQDGYTPLHLAVRSGQSDVVNYLLDNGSNIDAITNDGLTSLKIAIYDNKKNICDIFMKRNAKFTVEEEREFMLKAIRSGNVEIVEYLLSKNSRNGASNPKYDYYPLHVAVVSKQLNIVKTLVEVLDKKEIHVKNKTSNTPLAYAVNCNQCEIAKFLLLKGSDPNEIKSDGNALLNHAVAGGFSEIVKILLKGGADCFINGYNQDSVFHICITCKNLEILNILLNHSKLDVNQKFSKDFSMLHFAAFSGSLDIVKYLVDLNADINATNFSGAKPIHIAALEGHKSIVEYFSSLEFQADDRDKDGWTLLHYAACGNQIEMCVFLINGGIDINIEDNEGCTPLHIAVQGGITGVFQLLLHYGAYYDARNLRGETPLQMAKSLNNIFIITLLTMISNLFATVKNKDCSKLEVLLKEAEELTVIQCVKVKKVKKLTLIHYAAWKRRADIVELLLKYNADPNVQDEKGNTPLHYAVKLGDVDVVKVLLRL